MSDERTAEQGESSQHLSARITLGRMGEEIQKRLRDHDDPGELRTFLRSLLDAIVYLQKEQGYGGYGNSK